MWLTKQVAACLLSPVGGSSDFLVSVTGAFSTLAVSLNGAIKKKNHIIPPPPAHIFWLRCFPNRITECQRWKKDNRIHDSILPMKKWRPRRENGFTRVRHRVVVLVERQYPDSSLV